MIITRRLKIVITFAMIMIVILAKNNIDNIDNHDYNSKSFY